MEREETTTASGIVLAGRRYWLVLVLACAILSLALILPDGQTKPLQGWLAAFVVLAASGLVLTILWNGITKESAPRWLAQAIAIAVVIRLMVGLGLYLGLPRLGYEEPDQQQGYVYYDASSRDQDAWALGRSDKPLTTAFSARAESDQYGGLLYLSAAMYRTLSGGIHRPLLITAVTSALAGAAVLFIWAFVAMTFGSFAAAVSAWIAVLYPEFVLLAASQMREPFIVLGLAVALYGLARTRVGQAIRGLAWIAVGAALAAFVSPPWAALILGIAVLAWVWEGSAAPRLTILVLIGAGALALLALLVSARAWTISDPSLGGGGFLSVITRWLTEAPMFQLRVVTQGSGWAEKIFATTPAWTHMPLATLYGLTQPLLPAAIADHTGAAIWQAIAIWRSLGWTLLIPFVLYGSLAAFRGNSWRSMQVYLTVIVWAGILIASYRAAGDLWDNPRYRVIFMAAQAALAGWAWMNARGKSSPWLTRSFILVGIVLGIFFHWFAGRYFLTPRLSLYATLGLMAAAAGLLMGYWTLGDRRRIKRRSHA